MAERNEYSAARKCTISTAMPHPATGKTDPPCTRTTGAGGEQLQTVTIPSTKETLAKRYWATMRCEDDLKALGYRIACKWNCKFRNEMVLDDDVKTFMDVVAPGLDLLERLERLVSHA